MFIKFGLFVLCGESFIFELSISMNGSVMFLSSKLRDLFALYGWNPARNRVPLFWGIVFTVPGPIHSIRLNFKSCSKTFFLILVQLPTPLLWLDSHPNLFPSNHNYDILPWCILRSPITAHNVKRFKFWSYLIENIPKIGFKTGINWRGLTRDGQNLGQKFTENAQNFS